MQKFFLPAAALDQHIAILGKTGSGKTHTAKLVVEHVLNHKRQVCILDPTGAWWGIRVAADGKSPGHNIVLIGGEHADVPLGERSGAAVARLVTEQGASVVVDTSGLTVGAYTRWFIDFAGTLYTTLKNPLHLVIDEAHYFMPQGRVPDPDAGKMLHAGNRLMSGGRSRGIRGMLITQRPAKLHKDALTCADTLIAMRVIAPQDRMAVKEWIDGCGNLHDGRQVMDSLAQLQRGEGWVWYPEGNHLERVKFPPIATYDSSAAPKHGQKSGPKVSEIDLGEVRKALAEAVKEAEANDPKALRVRIAELEKQLRERPTTEKIVEKIVNVPMMDERQIGIANSLVTGCQNLADEFRKIVNHSRRPSQANEGSHPAPNPIRRPVTAKVPENFGRGSTNGSVGTVGNSGLRRMLIALACRPGLTNKQLGLRAQISSSSGTFGTYLGRGRSEGWIRDEGDRRFITDEGLAALGPYQRLPEGADLLQYWISELGNSGASRMLHALAEVYPNGLTNEQIGERAGISHTSGTFGTYMGRLRTLELVDGKGVVTASEELFS